MLSLKGKRALVTASTKGMGLATAMKLKDLGAEVFICSRNEKRVNDLIINHGFKGTRCDLSDPSSVFELSEKVKEELGGVDILVFNTGGPPPGGLELSLEEWDKSFNLLLKSAVILLKELLPYMVERKWGRVIFITSVAVKCPVPELMLSNSLRIGLLGLMKTLIHHYSKYNITFNAILPGYILTDRLRQVIEVRSKTEGRAFEEVLKEVEEKVPLKRVGKPEEVANVIAFLASDMASYVNGALIPVDGGLIDCL